LVHGEWFFSVGGAIFCFTVGYDSACSPHRN